MYTRPGEEVFNDLGRWFGGFLWGDRACDRIKSNSSPVGGGCQLGKEIYRQVVRESPSGGLAVGSFQVVTKSSSRRANGGL